MASNSEFARGPLISAGLLSLVIGIALGLSIAWLVAPVEFQNADPADLRPPLKEDYVRLISAAYELDGDLTTARRRLQALKLVNETRTFDDLIAKDKLGSNNAITRDALIHLGNALGLKLPYTAARPAPGAATPITVYVIATPSVQTLMYRLIEHTPLSCVDEPNAAHLYIIVRDAAGKDVPNIGIEIRGEDTLETIYTGLKPERGVGYADYEAAPGKYTLTILGAEAETVSDLIIGPAPANCRNDRATPRGWKLIFQQK